MRDAIVILAMLLMLSGAIWILQGFNVLPGSYMSGNPQWTINGAITATFGAVLFWFANRKK